VRPVLALFLAALLVACGGSTQLVATGPHPPHIQDFVEVPYPPPPAQVEEIQAAHSDLSCAYVSGHYEFETRRWLFRPGRWVRIPADCYYAPPLIAWSKSGDNRLYYTPPRWYRDDADARSEALAVCKDPEACR
jgi:hypothetical protein